LFSVLVCFTYILPAQDIIENPEKPGNAGAGRIVTLEKVLQISDTGAGYYFEAPRLPKVAPDRSIFVLDREQLLRFDRSGNFLRNYFKKGQGPGELQFVSNYFLADDHIVIHEARLNKIVYLSYGGEMVKEFRIEQAGPFMALITFINGKCIFQKGGIPVVKGQPKIVDVPNIIIAVSNDGSETQELQSFPTKSFVALKGGARGSIEINSLITAPYGKKFLFISHTPEYQVKLFDLEDNRVLRTFKRRYKRVKTPDEIKNSPRSYVFLNNQKFTAPDQEYLSDICHLAVVKNQLWVMTSTLDKEKGWLVDVYDAQGRYLDNFYLKFPEILSCRSAQIMGFRLYIDPSGDFLYRLRSNEEGLVELIKYRISR
jgi:hypothetical protein